MRYRTMKANAGRFRIGWMAKALDVSSSGYYSWLKRPEGIRKRNNRRLAVEIKAIHKASRQTYGSPRIHAELAAKGISCSRGRVARLMKEQGIRAKQKRKFRVTTDSKHSLKVAPNRLDRQFEARQPNQAWLADITYIPTREGWLYLAAVLDLHSRKIVGWSMSNRMKRKLVIDALLMAVWQRKPDRGLLHHSDRGSQYCSKEYLNLLKRYGIVCSMSRKGNCWDNAPMESFFHTLKTELIHHRNYRSRREAKSDIFNYIELFYNPKRRHSSLGYMSPSEYELIARVA
jgi:putative transposase